MADQPALSPVKQALAEIRELRGRLAEFDREKHEPIAIVGVAGRFPGAAGVDELWTLLRDGRIAIDDVPADRWDANAYFDEDQDAPGKMYVRRGGFLPGVDQFDPHFFGVSPREAVSMDPQQRLLLETSWRALEDAGIPPTALSGSETGVFVGLSNIDYYRMAFADRDAIDAYFGSGTSGSVAAGRISYVLGLRGPSLTVDTACSSSLVAIHLAVQSLRQKECGAALAGGVNLILTPDINIACSKAKMMAPDGLCKTFDARADGYVRSEGCAVVVLKRLSDAEKAGDRILAVIRGTAVNQDGRSGGLTVPNGPAQEAVIRRALDGAGVAPHEVTYVEAHGTGTSLGDPIEVRALGRVFEDRAGQPPLAIGSIKSNVGHLESAAGVAGLVKVLLALQREEIPGHPQLGERNPYIEWDTLPVDVLAAPRPWPRGERPRIAGLSSFGFSGTNAHVVLEEGPAAPVAPSVERTTEILTVSARTPEALEELCGDFERFLRRSSDPLAEICATANAGRFDAQQRIAAIGSSSAEIANALAAFGRGEQSPALLRGVAAEAPEPVFLFTGQGAQYAGMARTLYDTHPPFRELLDRSAKTLDAELQRPLLDVLFGADADTRLLHETAYAQPALFAVEYALAKTWMSWGIQPAAVAGHSVGELVAACLAGVFALEDGLRLIAARGRLMQALTDNGAMVSVFAGEEAVRAAIAGREREISVAAVNGPEQVVISGLRTAVAEVVASLESKGVRSRDLEASRAFHSPLLEPMLGEFARVAGAIPMSPPNVPVFSNLTGGRAGAEIATADYWVRHARQPVRFEESIQRLRREGRTVFLEVGPAPTLIALARRFADAAGVQWLHSLRQGRDDWAEMLRALGALYVAGAAIDWAAVDAQRPRRRVRVPGHPFRRQRYWLANDGSGAARTYAAAGAAVHPLLGLRIDSPLQDVLFEQRLAASAPAYLADHRVFDSVVFPATGYLEMALAAGRDAFKAAPIVENLVIAEPFVLPEAGERRVHTVFTPRADGEGAFQVFSRTTAGEGAEWHLHASAAIRTGAAPASAETLAAVRQRCTTSLAVDEHYGLFSRSGLEYGPAFRGITELWRGASEAVAAIALPADVDVTGYTLHPALLDSCFHALLAALPNDAAAFTGEHFYLPVNVDRLAVSGEPGARAWAHARLRPIDGDRPEAFAGDVEVFDDAGTLVASIAGLTAKRATAEALHAAVKKDQKDRTDWFYSIEWQPMDSAAGRELPAGAWLLMDDGSPLASLCAARLQQRGDTVTRAALDAGAIDTAAASGTPVRLLCFAPAGVSEGVAGSVQTAVERMTRVLSRIAERKTHGAPFERAIVVTHGATGDTDAALVAGPLNSLVAALGAEQGDLPCATIDVDAADAATVDAIWRDLVAPETEDRIAYRGGRRHVARLRRASSGAFRDRREAGGPVALAIAERGILDNLKLVPAPRRVPGPRDVEIEVAAAGLNFRDVLNALGMYPGDPGALGNECVGRVSAVGAEVANVRVGQRVMALVHGGFQSFAIAPADWVVEIPPAMDDAAAATIPMAFATAEYSLNRLARLRAGERVLVHAATGGVGLAAVQLAQRAGADIFATAGSDEKRALLRAMGVRHVMNSRTVDFAAEIMAATDGQGVDVVLNSLTGDAIPKSLSVLRAGGRFCEIGKRGIWSPEEVAALRPDVTYFKIFLAEVDDRLIQEMLRDLSARFAAGDLQPLRRRIFALEDAPAAFRHMAQARHIGKVVLARELSKPDPVRADASYLVTGGSGGLGLRVAEALVARGARHIVLAGRRDPAQAAREAIGRMEAAGATVTAVAADVSRHEDVARLFNAIASLPPLGGVVHAAGVREDGLLPSMTPDKLERVLAPKVAGAWNLHRATEKLDLDFFVMFSSAASVLPSPAQSNYAAANAFLDALARHRRGQGLPAISVNWGPWDEVGMAAGLTTRDQQRWARHGVSFIGPDEGIRAFERLLDARVPQLMVVAADWRKFSHERDGGIPLLADLVDRAPARKQTAAPRAASATLRQELDGLAPARRRDAVLAHVREQVRQVLALEAGYTFAPHQGLRDAGMDSLMALELRNRLQRTTGASLPATLTFDRPTIEALAAFLNDEVIRVDEGAAPGVRVPATPATTTVAAAEDAIAIVGIGCRFPGGADDPDAFWELLRGGVDAIREIPRDRWDVDAYFDPDPDAPGKMYTRRAGFIDRVDAFDPHFFGISPREAISLDPQQRLLLEVAWEALEDAGQAPDRLMGTKSAVFVGIGTYDYALLHMKQPNPAALDAYYGTGTSLSVAAGRLAYCLGLQGPAMSIDTACSSSLVAVHLACKSLREGECRLALAGGVNLMLTPEPFVNGCRAHMLAPDGACKTFDAAANGYVRAEGAGVVVLKRLAHAIEDGDRVLAIVRGSAVNQDGRSSGLTVPHGPSQQAVIRQALDNAGVSPADVDYVEAHGTGTALGDPIEMEALRTVLTEGRSAAHPLVVGSVKTNVGHLEAAAGVAGLIKVVLAMRHREIPRNLHFTSLNPHIALDGAPVEIATSHRPWSAAGARRVAGVSSFGFSGTNAHVIVEEAPEPTRTEAAAKRPVQVLPLSAKSADALSALATRYADHLDRTQDELHDVAFTAAAGRSQFDHRLAVCASTRADARDALRACASRTAHPAVRQGAAAAAPAVAMLFTGQGAQHPGMARQLYDSHPVFRETLTACDALLRREFELPLLDVLFAGDPDMAARIDQTAVTQPALFAIEHALAELWRSWGVRPAAVMGHSVGEYVAAVHAGVFGWEDGLRLIASRGRLMQSAESGAMAAVFAPESEVEAVARSLAPRLSVAAVNGPSHTVVSGTREAVDAAVALFSSRGVTSQPLVVSHAFHSSLMDPILDEFERVAGTMSFAQPALPIVSNLTGRVAGSEIATPAYWRRHLREAVRFADGVNTIVGLGCSVLLEVGPKPTLTGLAKRIVPDGGATLLSSLKPPQHDWAQIADCVASLYAAGSAIDWNAFDAPFARRKVSLPRYPFERQRYWLDGTGLAETPVKAPRAAAEPPHEEEKAARAPLYKVSWIPAEPAVTARTPAAGDLWIVAGTDAVADDFAAAVRKTGAQCQRLTESSALVSADLSNAAAVVFVASPGEAAAPAQLVTELTRSVQALVTRGARAALWILTRGAQSTGPSVASNPAHAALWGLGRTIAVEHPEIWGGLLDLDEQANGSSALETILGAGDEDQCALRGGARYVPRLKAAEALSADRPVVRGDAAYLVTGGLGSIGLEAARWLADLGARHLVLLGRSGLPDRNTWDEAPAFSDLARRIAGVRAVEWLGASVDVVQVDIADREAVSAIVSTFGVSRPPLAGVLHAAAAMGGVRIDRMQPADVETMFGPKVEGARVLAETTRDRELDFFVVFSSISALIGTADLAHYAAANAWLDGFAEQERAAGRRMLSVNWGAWENLRGSRHHVDVFSRSGMRALEAGAAFDALGCLLARDAARAVVASVDWKTFVPVYEARRRRPFLDIVAAPPAAPSEPAATPALIDELAACETDRRLDAIVAHVRGVAASVLGLAARQVDTRKGFFDLGMDSLLSVELRTRLQRSTGIALPTTLTFKYPTVAAVAEYLLDELTPEAQAAPAAEAGAAQQEDDLSEDELAKLLASKLAQMQ